MIGVLFINQISAQLNNVGANITIQENALVHVEGDFSNFGGSIFNSGTLEVGGDWTNTVSANPLVNEEGGLVAFIGQDQSINGGQFGSVFGNVELRNNLILTLNTNIGIHDVLQLNNGIVDINDNLIHFTNSSPAALSWESGGIISERTDEIGLIRWDVGEQSEGEYVIPFINSFETNIPFSFEITQSGVGSDGYFLIGTYGTDEANGPLPLGVDNIQVDGTDTGFNLVDRFWSLDVVDYEDTPNVIASFEYDVTNESSGMNTIESDDLIVINYDEPNSSWVEISENTVDENVITTQLVDTFGVFSLLSKLSTSIFDNGKRIDVDVFPNPTRDYVELNLDLDRSSIVEVIIVDNVGRVLYTDKSYVGSGNNNWTVNIEEYNSGIYHVRIVGEDFNALDKFVKL